MFIHHVGCVHDIAVVQVDDTKNGEDRQFR